MKRSLALRLVALLVLLLHGGAFAAASVLDGSVAARANAQRSHVETGSGADCAAHDEASCLLCRVGTSSGWLVARAVSAVVSSPSVPFAPDADGYPAAAIAGARHSRAPPVA